MSIQKTLALTASLAATAYGAKPAPEPAPGHQSHEKKH
jgi:hypothetical protein